eukprot:scaffold54253_cov77-Attheya_sp.AAC.2
MIVLPNGLCLPNLLSQKFCVPTDKRGCVAIKGSITVCPKCGLKHSSEEHMLKRIRDICPEITCFPDTLSHRLEILIMRHIYTYLLCSDKNKKKIARVLLQITGTFQIEV